jgi:hypothetical protein
MTPAEWDVLLRSDARKTVAYAHVAEAARAVLVKLDAGATLSTNDLVEALYPRAVADKSLAGDNARGRIYKALADAATRSLKDCATKGPPEGKKFMGRPVRPWIWHAPKELDVCVHCGQFMPGEE